MSVQSPTYTYLHIYDDRILHIDMRRLETEEQFLQLGVFDLIDQYDYVVIEWPKRTELYLDSERKTLAIRKEDDYRILTVSYST